MGSYGVPVSRESLMRIGAPPPIPPAKRKPRLLLVALLAAVFGVVMTAAGVLLPHAVDKLAALSPASPSPSRANLGEHGACVMLIGASKDAAELVLALVAKSDGSTVDWDQVRKTIGDLKTVRDVAPPDMVGDIQIQIDVLERMLAIYEGREPNQTLRLTEFRASGQRVGMRCAKYAS